MDVDRVRDKTWKEGMLADRFYAYVTSEENSNQIGHKLENINYDLKQD